MLEIFGSLFVCVEPHCKSPCLRRKKKPSCRPFGLLVVNLDCHFLAVLTVLAQFILGLTDCPESLLGWKNPSSCCHAYSLLKIMFVTKENAAAHVFAKHIESLLPRIRPCQPNEAGCFAWISQHCLTHQAEIIGCRRQLHQECTA